MRLDVLAKELGGELDGSGDVEISGVASLMEAAPSHVSFLGNPRYAGLMVSTQAAAVIVAADWAGDCSCALIRVADPDRAFAEATRLFAPLPPQRPTGVHATAVVANDVALAPDAAIGAHCIIEQGAEIGAGTVLWGGCYVGQECVIGAGCILYPGVSLRERTQLGDRVILHNGAVVGSDGFGYSMTPAGWEKIPQTGYVVVEDDVEIGANATIDRARFGRTLIGRGTKIDNLVQVAHNVVIGPHCALAAQVGLAGSASLGEGVQVGGQGGVGGHVHIGDRAVLGGQAGATKDLEGGKFYSGLPATLHQKQMRMQANSLRVPELRKQLRELEKRLAVLESNSGGA